MPRLAALLLSLTALVPAGALAAGCGSDGVATVSAAEAAATTRSAETARVAFRVRMSGMGLPIPLDVKGSGVTATGAPKMDLTFDFGDLVRMAGAGDDGKTRFLLDGGDLFIDPPAIEGLRIPGGARWVTADLTAVLKALGIDAHGLGELMRLSPAQQFDALTAAGSVKRVGEEKIDGVETVHLRGTVTLADYLEALPADRRTRAEEALHQLERLPGADREALDAPTPVSLWVDADKRVRRMTQKTTLPAQKGVPSGTYEMTMDLTDFGTPLDVTAPKAGEVYDATDAATRTLRAAGDRTTS